MKEHLFLFLNFLYCLDVKDQNIHCQLKINNSKCKPC